MFVKLKNMTPFKLCVIQEFPFIEADFDAVTSYQLLCKVVEYLNNVIAAENAQNDNINELNEAINALTDYVNEIGEKVDDFDEEFTTKTLKSISLILSGNAAIGGNLTVDGEFSLNDKATIDADVDIKQDLMVDGFTNLKSAELEGDLIVGGGISIDNKEVATVDMIPDISGKLDKTGGTITGNLEITGDLAVDDDFSVDGDLIGNSGYFTELQLGGKTVATVDDIPEPVDISGKYDKTGGTISGDVNVTGKLAVGNSHVEPNIIATPVVTASSYISTPQILNPAGKFGTPITVDSKLNITNGVILGADSTMNGVKLATVDDIPTSSGDMGYIGTVGTGGSVTDLPTPSEENKGDVYKVIEDGDYTIEENGKNIYTTYLEQGTMSSGAKTDSGTRIRSNAPIQLEPNTQYVISWKPTKNILRIDLCFYRANGTYVDRDWYWSTDNGDGRFYYTFVSESFVSVLPYFSTGSNAPIIPTDISEIQLEKGATPTIYEAPSNYIKAYKGDLFIGNVSEWVHVPSGTAGTIEHDLMIDGNLTVGGTGIITADEITGVNSFSAKNGNFTETLDVVDLNVSGSTVIDADVTINAELTVMDNINTSGNVVLDSGQVVKGGVSNHILLANDDNGDMEFSTPNNIIMKPTKNFNVNTIGHDNVTIKAGASVDGIRLTTNDIDDNIEIISYGELNLSGNDNDVRISMNTSGELDAYAYHDININGNDNVNITSTEQSVNINSGDTLTIQTSADGNITTNDNLNMTSSEDEVHINGANGIYIRQTNDDNTSQLYLDSDGWYGVKAKTRADIEVEFDGGTFNTLTIDNEGMTFNGENVATIKKIPDINIEIDNGQYINLDAFKAGLTTLYNELAKGKRVFCNLYMEGDNGSGTTEIVISKNKSAGYYRLCDGSDYLYYDLNLAYYTSTNSIRIYAKRSDISSTYFNIFINLGLNELSIDINDNIIDINFTNIMII